MKWLPLSAALLATIGATAASAHPKIVSASPAANAVVAKADRVELHFSEKLVGALTGSTLSVAQTHGGMTHTMPVTSTTTVGADGKTLIVAPKAPLAAGAYQLDWHAVSVDTHRVTGIHKFTVR
jgi:methionine-rich copper-binding protein CopC